MGNTRGMINLAISYENGDGVSQDKQKAIELYQRAIDMGNALAIYNLGCFYLKEDKKKAIELFQKASDMGNTNEMINLAFCY